MPAAIELRESPKRPPIHVVVREGDPLPAVAMAIAIDGGTVATTALGGLLERRLREQGFLGVELRSHGLGLVVQTAIRTSEEGAQFITACEEALKRPAGADDAEAADLLLQQLGAHQWGKAERWVGSCSGEAGLAPGVSLPALGKNPASLDEWRTTAYSRRAVAFAAVGTTPVVDAVAKAVAKTRPWPEGPEARDPWPDSDRSGMDHGPRERRLSLALRLGDGGQALGAAQLLAEGSVLQARLQTIGSGWHPTDITTTLRPRGACLRVDLDGPDGDPPPPPQEVAAAALVAWDEAERALSRAPDSAFSLQQSLLAPPDPRDAAGAAAWQALTARQTPKEVRRFAAYRGEEASFDLSQAIADEERSWRRGSVEVRHQVEQGQGEVWALLATPCGTVGESAETAGHTALLVRTLAERTPRLNGVALEPWVTAEGVGLLAHGPRLSPTETADEHATRVGEALGQALSTPLEGRDVAASRSLLQDALGPGPRPGWWIALEALAPNRPSSLEPHGTWHSLAEVGTHAVVVRRTQFAAGPLRLAVLANHSEEQPAAVAHGAQRWIRSLRGGDAKCPAVTIPPARVGMLEVETSKAPNVAAAHVGVRFPAQPNGMSAEARYTAWLLEREGGWLDQALEKPGLVAGARVRLLGGNRAAALIVTLEADEASRDEAVAQVRALFARLAKGAVTKQALSAAHAAWKRHQAQGELDPRRRVVEVWRATDPKPPTLASLRRFHAKTFAADHHVVVVVTQVE